MKALIYAAALTTAMLGSSLHAQTIEARANVPFSFRMGEAVMPPGQYRIHESGGLLTLREETGKKAAMHLTRPESRNTVSQNPALIFTRYGDELYLEKVWAGLSNEGQVLIPGKREKELAARFTNKQNANVILEAKSK
jgi:hypothetical protein